MLTTTPEPAEKTTQTVPGSLETPEAFRGPFAQNDTANFYGEFQRQDARGDLRYQ